ncbi:DUF6482 family protein [Vibrio sp. SCSIO 43136]|uniref:DUF6482 family protein n=1 Tax=Vibrio sp. SCSIO 43136 TaxID=2819101 RepID=UPI002075558A|nr:DUF6482 family protein [Vibrio sp. SCSIO 43136]USD64883.1 hypothetical protein J4N39_12485 [Vibrio sp. SCSIO 43136]
MRKEQFDHWLHAKHLEHEQDPKIFVISCADIGSYLLAVEFKHHLEPIRIEDEPIHFQSLEQVKDELHRLGVQSAYLRLHNAYDECGSNQAVGYHDIELSVH